MNRFDRGLEAPRPGHRFGLILAALVGMLILGAAIAEAAAPAGQVVAVEGEVYRQAAGQSRWLPVRGRMPLGNGDQLTTFAESRAMLQFPGDVLFVLGPESQLTIPRPPSGLRGLLFRMQAGVFRLLAPERARRARLLVETPTAVAAVRGTELMGEVSDERAGIAVLRGEVEVRGSATGGLVRVRAGEGTDVAAGQDPTTPAPWGAQRLERLMGLTTLR
jgi:hypothetical protein